MDGVQLPCQVVLQPLKEVQTQVSNSVRNFNHDDYQTLDSQADDIECQLGYTTLIKQVVVFVEQIIMV